MKERPLWRCDPALWAGSRRLLAPLQALTLAGVLLGICSADAQETKSGTTSALPRPYPQRLQWWADARLGMFIHWGPVSLKATEISWSRANSNPACPNRGEIPVEVYDNLYHAFNPTNFDAAQWVRLAQAAGMKYMVLTAKHCDGFLLWDSKVSPYNIMNSPFRRDVCKELANAAHLQGMKIGWYFSPMDWRDPDCRSEHNDRFVAAMQEELRELLTNYGRIDLLWFDYDGHEVPWDQERTYALVKKLQPNIIINNRLDLGPRQDAARPESLGPQADYYTPEQRVGGFDLEHPWESCMTVSKRGQWSWGGPGDGVKSQQACMNMLLHCAGGDGNMLLNVGPTPTGEIALEQAGRLKEMGTWLAKYGESIYGTRGGPFKPGSYGVSTRKARTIYIHITDWIEDPLSLPAIPAKVLSSRVLSGGTPEVRQTGTSLEISLPERDRQPIDTIVALELDREANQLAASEVLEPMTVFDKAKATASNVFQGNPEFGADKAVDGRRDTRWATDAGLHQAWLELDLGSPATFSRVRIAEAFPNRIQRFELQQFDGATWKPFCAGTTVGESWSSRFAPVTAQKVRLDILEATDGPTIWEFQLLK